MGLQLRVASSERPSLFTERRPSGEERYNSKSLGERKGIIPETRNPKPILVADHREDEHFLRQLSEFFEVKQASLELGDIQINDKIIIERKTRADFEQSIIDGRLFTQLSRMAEIFPRVILIVEGEGPPERLHKNAVLGAYSAIVVDFGATIFFTRNMRNTAELVQAIVNYLAKAPTLLRTYFKRKPRSFDDRKLIVAEGFAGPASARALLKEFGTIKRIISAGKKRLAAVIVGGRRLGEKKADELVKIFTEIYRNNEKEADDDG
ncbi:hypothetical protein COT30_02290 [Candidatus Micrarchaeota archaeon CG08_land_8_20_14_0_20_49_17]|nr:MAG: hypothetical protein COT30_02290 [Candidatus Micrarchaeota archaeon CG08_land_8_20_14_0_20_49_17]PIZ95462.1 MAG: hypothetical protein COX84_04495 [Candidatus Micrarchaeota archaeon CG_4_10_14_0_2_um_filter_49_7]